MVRNLAPGRLQRAGLYLVQTMLPAKRVKTHELPLLALVEMAYSRAYFAFGNFLKLKKIPRLKRFILVVRGGNVRQIATRLQDQEERRLGVLHKCTMIVWVKTVSVWVEEFVLFQQSNNANRAS